MARSYIVQYKGTYLNMGAIIPNLSYKLLKNYAVLYNFYFNYRNDPKFSDILVWANSADPDQTTPRGAVLSGSSLFASSICIFLIKYLLEGLATLFEF